MKIMQYSDYAATDGCANAEQSEAFGATFCVGHWGPHAKLGALEKRLKKARPQGVRHFKPFFVIKLNFRPVETYESHAILRLGGLNTMGAAPE